MEQAAVGVIALELDVERGREVEGLCGSSEAALDVIGLLGHGQRIDVLQLQAIFELDLLLVVGNQSLLLDIAIVENSRRLGAVLVSGHRRGRWECVVADDEGGVLAACRDFGRGVSEFWVVRYLRR